VVNWRFKDLINLQLQDYVFLPGDNDVGGEGVEPVDYIKLKWFNQTFGDLKKPLIYKKQGWDVQFLKV